jgi:RecB family exonuclease
MKGYTPLSFSRLNTFTQCPRRFYLTAIQGLPDGIGIPAIVGRAVHTFTALYDAAWTQQGKAAFETWKACRDEAIVAASPPVPPAARDEMTSLCHEYAARGEPDVDGLIAIEERLAIDKEGERIGYAEPTAWFRGVLDRVQLRGTVARIRDVKTTQLATSDKFQLRDYALLTAANWEQVQEISLVFDYLRLGWKDEYQINREDALAVRLEILLMEREIERRHAAGNYEEAPGQHCLYCLHWRRCPMGSRAKIGIMPETQAELDDLANDYAATAVRRKAIKAIMTQYVENGGPCRAGGRQWKFRQRTDWEGTDPVALFSGLREAGIDWTRYTSVNWEALREAAEEDPRIREILDQYGHRVVTVELSATKRQGGRDHDREDAGRATDNQFGADTSSDTDDIGADASGIATQVTD